jgi:hypothetical protein
MKAATLYIKIYDALGQTKASNQYDLVHELIDIEPNDGDYMASEGKLATLGPGQTA